MGCFNFLAAALPRGLLQERWHPLTREQQVVAAHREALKRQAHAGLGEFVAHALAHHRPHSVELGAREPLVGAVERRVAPSAPAVDFLGGLAVLPAEATVAELSPPVLHPDALFLVGGQGRRGKGHAQSIVRPVPQHPLRALRLRATCDIHTRKTREMVSERSTKA